MIDLANDSVFFDSSFSLRRKQVKNMFETGGATMKVVRDPAKATVIFAEAGAQVIADFPSIKAYSAVDLKNYILLNPIKNLSFEEYKNAYNLMVSSIKNPKSASFTGLCQNMIPDLDVQKYPILSFMLLENMEKSGVQTEYKMLLEEKLSWLKTKYSQLFFDANSIEHCYWACTTSHPECRDDFAEIIALDGLSCFVIERIDLSNPPPAPVYKGDSILSAAEQLQLRDEIIEISKGEPFYVTPRSSSFYKKYEDKFIATAYYLFGNTFPDDNDTASCTIHEKMQFGFDKKHNTTCLVCPVINMCLNFMAIYEKGPEFYDEFFMNIINDPGISSSFYHRGLRLTLKTASPIASTVTADAAGNIDWGV